MIVLMGNCGAFRVAPLLQARTGDEVRVLGWAQVDQAIAMEPELIYVDLFGFDVFAPACVAAATGRPIPPIDLNPLRTVVATLAGAPVVYRGLRRPSAGAFGLLERNTALDAWFDELESVIAGQRVLDVQGLWARAGIPMDDVAAGLGHGEPLGGGDGKSSTVSAAMYCEAGWLESVWASRALPRIACVVVDLDLFICGDLRAPDFHARNPAWLPLGETAGPGALEAWWHMERGIHEALRIVNRRGVALALTTRHDHDTVARRFRLRAPEPDDNPGPFAWMYDTLPEPTRASVFAVHPTLVNRLALQFSDFATVEASPEQPKSASCRRIAARLGIDLNALLFLGADAVDRAEVRRNTSEVTVPDCPVKGFREVLLHGPRLSPWRDTSPAPAERVAASRGRIESLDDVLRSLRIVVSVRRASAVDYPRVEELLILCTDLNLTGERPELDGLDAIYVGTCRDELNDYGIVAAGLIKGSRLVNWVCSCRVLPLRVAGTLLYLTLQSNPGIRAEFVKTGTNLASRDLIRESQLGCVDWVSVDR